MEGVDAGLGGQFSRHRYSFRQRTMSQGPTAAFDPKLIVPFVKSVREVIKTMVGLEVTVGRPGVKSDPVASFDVSSIIQFGGDVMGTVVLSFEMKAAEAIVNGFAGMEIEPKTPEFADAVGELCNMVSGAAKRELGYEASIGIPSVIVGRGHQIARLKDVPCLSVPCNVDAGSFAVEVSIKSIEGACRIAA